MKKSSPFNSTHYVVLYPKNGDRIVTIDSVTPLHPMYMFIIPAKARDYVFTGVGLSVCLFVCYHDN